MGRDSSEINGRFRKLLAEFSQAEIARRCEIPPSNVSRYVNGQRIPADVCSRLVRSLGVNPLWLLTGEGPLFGEPVNEASQDAATGLRRLLDQLSHTSVRALDAVPRALKDGSLANLRRDLTSLNDVQKELHGHVQELYQELLNELIAALDSFAGDRADQILQQLRDLETVCHDSSLVRQRRNLEAVILLDRNRQHEALEIQREIFREAMASFGDVEKPQLMQEFNFIATLRSCGYFVEARAYARALVELRRPLEQHAEYWLLRVLGAFLEIELGALASGLEQLSRSLAHVPEKYKHENYSLVICAHLLQGTLTLDSARASEASRVESRPASERVVSALSLLRFAMCVDAGPTTARILTDATDLRDYPGQSEDPCLRFAEAVATVERGEATPADALHRLVTSLAEHPTPPEGSRGDALRQIEHLAGATRFACIHQLPDAEELWSRTQDAIDELEEQQRPRLLTRWLHARNTLRVAESAESIGHRLRDAAGREREFIDDYVRRGYVAFRAEETDAATGEEVA